MSLYNPLFQLNFKNRNKGFTLLELILYLAIGSIIILTISSLLNLTKEACLKAENEEEILLNARYAIEYIKNEIKMADKIISIDKIEGLDKKYEKNLGFIVFKHDPSRESGYEYNFATYYLKDNKIYRDATNRNNYGLPRATAFSGHNVIAENIRSIEGTQIDFERKIIELKFILKDVSNKEYEFQSVISIRCTVEN